MIVGIDLGTTNSLVGAFVDGAPRLFPNAAGEHLTPSAVSVGEDGGVMVGAGARDRIITHPDRSAAHFKRWMGSPREAVLGGRNLRAEQLSALVLKSLAADAAAATGEAVTEAVVSVPAYFSDAQRSATRAAGELAGIKVERLINEPTAAALAYGLQERGEGRFLVFDLGGGTLDVSIIEMFDGVVDVHATAGDNFLGGEDFLDVLVAAAGRDLGIDVAALPPGERAQLRRRLEALKLRLGAGASAEAGLRLGGRDLAWGIDEARFSSLAEPLTRRLRAPLERSLRDANLSPGDLDEVVLVGGASRMPLVLRTVSRLLGRLPLRHVDPDRAVALGAAVAAGMKARDAKLEETILTDVCPYTLGIETSRQDGSGTLHTDLYLPIIARSSAVPVSREQEVWPVREDQDRIVLEVYQGENPIARKNVRLGTLPVPLPPGPGIGGRGVRVRFTYDVNGILQVEATVSATGERRELVVEQNPGALSPDEVRARLAALAELKVHPRDAQENLAMIARAERVYEECVAERERLQGMIVQFRAALDSQDGRRIARERRDFGAALDAIEPR